MTYYAIDVGDRTTVVELLRQIQPGPGMAAHQRVLEVVADQLEQSDEVNTDVEIPDVVRELRKVHDTVRSVTRYMYLTDTANAERHMARTVRSSPLTNAVETAADTLAAVIERIDPTVSVDRPLADVPRSYGGDVLVTETGHRPSDA